MAIGDGYVTALGTVVVAALAIGAAVGTHALVGDKAVDAGASPSVTIAMSDDFCTVMGDLNSYYAARSAESGVLSGTIDLTAAEDPAVLDAIHQQADPLLEITAGMAAYLGHGAEVVADATVAEALRTESAYIKAQGATFAQLSRDATSVEGFVTAMFGAAFDPAAQQSAADSQAASVAIGDYVTAECSIDLSAVLGTDSSADPGTGSGDSSDGAKTDATTLGQSISVAFVDWKEGDPLPQVSVEDGMFAITVSSVSDGGTSTGTSSWSADSSDPVIVDQSIAGPLDWCVSVADNAAASPTTYRYSVTGGVEEGTCAALAGT